ncbi:hypothetical protein BJ875DRAFT_443215 [Amylocarpus encephaloides]|uniref:BZIP domain-containing protein n=1 Tax=Amylocarpus encephaloides TaxID=45428 RepID=A0A9P8C4U2_9HELO|nr:hypothetical protein BJ875DRAFT_443215 [Amylocarpus encephaloides]
MSSPSDKSNLARIRDNQRRSRARRREYLTELESKLRQCEHLGVEASTDIQLAARRVADENKKLRLLLAQHGIGDDTVDTYLSTPLATSDPLGGLQPSSTSLQVQVLEQSLQQRKPCCPDGKGDIVVMETRAGSNESILSATKSAWDAAQQYIPTTAPMTGPTPPTESTCQFSMPTSSAASQNAASHVPLRDDSHHYRTASFSQHGRPRSHLSDSSNYQSNQFTPQSPQHKFLIPMSTHTMAQENFQSYNESQQTLLATPSENVNSCLHATRMIATMAGGDEAAVQADLGCLPNTDCNVDNQLVFDVMDRYSGGPPL